MTHTWLIWLTHNVMLSKHDSAWQHMTHNAVISIRTLYNRYYRALWLVSYNNRIQYLPYVVMDTLVHAQHCNCISTGPYGSVRITTFVVSSCWALLLEDFLQQPSVSISPTHWALHLAQLLSRHMAGNGWDCQHQGTGGKTCSWAPSQLRSSSYMSETWSWSK